MTTTTGQTETTKRTARKRTTRPKYRPVPAPFKSQGRICFGINWYRTEAEAIEAGEIVRERGETYNGGYFHGMPCGRDKQWDYDDADAGRLYAVTTR